MPLADLPQTNKMHAVPQNIMDVEFKLIGDLTLRQFIYLFVFGGSAYVSFVVLVGIFKWPIVILCVLLGVGLAFVPIQERGLDEWIVNFVKSVYSPTQRIWSKEPTVPSAFMYENLAVVRQELITLAPTSSRRRLEEYLEYKLADATVDPLDIPEKEYIMKVREAFGDQTPAAPVSVGVGLLEPEIDTGLSAAYPASAGYSPQPPIEEQPPVQPEQQPEESVTPAPAPQAPAQEPAVVPIPEPVVQEPPKSAPQPVTPPVTPTQQFVAHPIQQPKPITEPVSQPKPAAPAPAPQVQKPTPARPARQRLRGQFNRHQGVTLSPMTPDMHSGRRFINLVPKSGELVLPIRGERVIRTSEEIEVEADIKDKAEKLQQLLSQIKKESGIVTAPAQQRSVNTAASSSPGVNQEAESLAEKLKNEQARLSSEISKLEAQKTATQAESSEKDALIQRMKTEKERTERDYEALQRQILDLQEKLKTQQPLAPAMPTAVPASYATSSTIAPDSRPNVLTGTVKTKEGNFQEGLLLIVKNSKGEAVRALKTNSIGVFKLSTPLANGTYTIEVATNNTGSTFDIISVEAKGAPIYPIEIVGH